MKALIGVMSEELIRHRVIAIAKGEYHPKSGEPKIWFTSMIALAQIISNKNIELLRLMASQNPATITELAQLSGRKVSNLSATLKTLSHHGFVKLEKMGKQVKPIALFTDFEIHVTNDFANVSDNSRTGAA